MLFLTIINALPVKQRMKNAFSENHIFTEYNLHMHIIAIIGFFVSVQNETVKEKKFLCTHCDYKATKNGHLKKKSVHEGLKFQCPHTKQLSKETFRHT